jgi:hypothetical protein
MIENHPVLYFGIFRIDVAHDPPSDKRSGLLVPPPMNL